LATFETGHRSTLITKKFQAAGHRLESTKRRNVVARVLDTPRVADFEFDHELILV
jgi:hypothetical protein